MVATILSVLSLIAPHQQRSVFVLPAHSELTIAHQCLKGNGHGGSDWFYWRREDVYASGQHLRVHWNSDQTLEYWNAYRQTAVTFNGITFSNDSDHTVIAEGTC